MSRLYLKVYGVLLGIVLAFFVLTALWWGLGPGASPRDRELLAGSASLAQEALPPAGAPAEQLEQQVARLSEAFGAGVAVFDANGALLARSGEPLPAPSPRRNESHWLRHPHGPAAALRLADGRWVVASFTRTGHGGFAWHLALLAGVIAVGAYPLARGITRRIERLEQNVDALGAGDLSARAPVEGRDEVAGLARSFNRAAGRIQALVESQRTLLASASHELRSPLARIRVAAELLVDRAGSGGRDTAEQLESDIARLDGAIDELLAVSRLGLLDATAGYETVDLLALAAEEGAGLGAAVDGVPATVVGDARSLRHLVRNLLHNAVRHAPGKPPDVVVEARAGGGAVLRVADRGPGVPEAVRGRIFEPFARGGADPAAEGVGLGLAIVQQIARHHGGEARCRPRDGGGSVFEVDLPGRATRPKEGT
jgi:signal transduction histidine kinase